MTNIKKNIFLKSTSNKLALGTVQFGLEYGINSQVKPSFNVVDRILDMAYDNGIRILDSAEDYGSSLDVISRFHKKRNFKFKIINKINRIPNNQNISQLIDSRLIQLEIESFYAVYFNNPKCIYDNKKIIDELVKLKSNGKKLA